MQINGVNGAQNALFIKATSFFTGMFDLLGFYPRCPSWTCVSSCNQAGDLVMVTKRFDQKVLICFEFGQFSIQGNLRGHVQKTSVFDCDSTVDLKLAQKININFYLTVSSCWMKSHSCWLELLSKIHSFQISSSDVDLLSKHIINIKHFYVYIIWKNMYFPKCFPIKTSKLWHAEML